MPPTTDPTTPSAVVIQNLVIATGVMALLVTWVFVGAATPLGPEHRKVAFLFPGQAVHPHFVDGDELVEKPEEPQAPGKEAEAKKERQQAAVQGIVPDQPAPIVPEPQPKAEPARAQRDLRTAFLARHVQRLHLRRERVHGLQQVHQRVTHEGIAGVAYAGLLGGISELLEAARRASAAIRSIVSGS